MATQYIGTSGFVYPHWRGAFYPEKLASKNWLSYYATQFNTVELNNTFYRFPRANNLKSSAANTPDNFKFTVKAHKLITHNMRMRNAKDKIEEYMDIVAEGLGDKLYCVLFQLPPSYHYTEERLEDILNNVAHRSTNIIEFRHRSWWNEHIYDTLKKHNLTFCSVSFPNLPEDNIITSDIFYKRMHGVPHLFASPYSHAQLKTLAKDIPKNIDSVVYFNNTSYDSAYSNALFLKGLLEKKQAKRAAK